MEKQQPMKQIPKLIMLQEVWLRWQQGRRDSAVQVCLLMITVLKLPAQVLQQYLNKAQQGNMFYHQDDTPCSGNYLLSQSKKFLSISCGFGSSLKWLISRGMLPSPILLLETIEESLKNGETFFRYVFSYRKPPMSSNHLLVCHS